VQANDKNTKYHGGKLWSGKEQGRRWHP
jgi:hypothetical protein